MFDFQGQTVLVTGGSCGIGNAIARYFKASGANVHVTGTRADPGCYQGEEGSDLSGLSYHQLDASDAAQVDSFDLDDLGLHHLVNSIGITHYRRREFEMDALGPSFR